MRPQKLHALLGKNHTKGARFCVELIDRSVSLKSNDKQ